MAIFLFVPHRQITWSDNLLHQFQEGTKFQWPYYRCKHYSHHEFMVMGKLGNFFSCLYWQLEGDHRKQHNFHHIPVPPPSAEKLIWPSCKKEKGVGKGNNNCLSYQCLYHLRVGAGPNNSACFGSRCLLQLLCTGLTAPINSLPFLWLRVAVIWVYECEICLALPPSTSDWG